MRRLVLVLAVLACALGFSSLATPGSGRADRGGNSYSIGLWGDVPYSVDQQTNGVPNLIADMNRSHLAFTVHDGDLKQGSGSPCDDALYTRSEGYFTYHPDIRKSMSRGAQEALVTKPLEPVEHEVEPELEGVHVVLARLGLHVLVRVLREVREVGGEVPLEKTVHDVLQHLGVDGPVVQDERREALGVALDDVVRVERQLLREARVPEASEKRLAVLVWPGPDPAGRASRAVRRGPPLAVRARHLRDAEHPGVEQQPRRHESRSR